MKNIVCMKWGTKFGANYVNALYKMVKKNITGEFRFICFTENPEGLLKEIEVKPLPEMDIDPNAPERGWRKISMFSDKINDIKGPALFLDLDIVILRNIDEFFEAEGDFLIIKDWDFPDAVTGNSSVFRFEFGKHPDVLEYFVNNTEKVAEDFRNEQAYLSDAMHKKGIIKYWNSDWCVSFKRHCLQKFPMNFFKEPECPANAKILIFHGRPTPEQAINGFWGKMGFRYVKPTKWINDYRQI